MPLLTAHGIRKAYGASVLLEAGELHIRHGERIGLVGLNGSGKSTLMRILAGTESPDGGDLAWRKDIRVTYLPQIPELDDDDTLLDVAMAGAARERSRPDRVEQEVAARRQLNELGVPDADMKVAVASGGTRRRAAIAAALLERPDLLLADEPTNHLDMRTVEWLERALCSFPGALMLITHDRYFLNTVVDRIVELRQRKLFSWPGTFEDYLAGRLEQEQIEARTERNRKRRLSTELEWLRRSPKARTTKQKARIQRAQALGQSDYEASKQVRIEVRQAQRLGKRIVDCWDLDIGHPGHAPLVSGVRLSMTRGMRIGVVGDNGVGKTTLLRTLIGEHPPLAGKLDMGVNTRALHIDQHRAGLDPDATVRELGSISGGDWVQDGDRKVHVASYLEGFLFRSDDLRQKVGTLSGGQRFRLLMARRLQEPMNLLVLDEPTNDLDFETLRVLEEALIAYPGCLVVVSHDRAFMDRVCTHLLELQGGGGWELHAGNWSQWQERLKARRSEQQRARKTKVKAAVAADAPPKLTWAEQKRLQGIEAEIERAEERVAAAEETLADPAVATDYPRLTEATAALNAATAARDEVYTAWQYLEDKQAAWQAHKDAGAKR